ncbi:MipA/OmpV family protein [Neorhizobium galegae]|uniref:MltA-interacting MipA family protein n=1 Tax=Neorhizobium galegae bv. officinalis TaxID=323656 RepID=A0A0T7GC12_NEOGA|nr:MipA/OmpV family protein [Neorhizobium galegae]CDZ44728.1 MltA-interacting MipA family protein [Neorhizobium galegae bv. officinalis]
MSLPLRAALFISLFSIVSPGSAAAQEGFWSGDWYLTLGGAGFVAPKFEGDNGRSLQFSPIISLGRQNSKQARFSSRNDSISFALIDQGSIRAGVAAKLIMPRDGDTSDDLKGLKEVKLGGELGGFVDIYPTDWIRARAEIRQGIRSHDGVVADVSVDAFTDLQPDLRLSGGPRATWASNGYNDAYYKVTPSESAASGLSAYDPGSGLHSVGVGAALTWKATEQLELTSFAEYKRLTGDVADSSLVRERGSKNQLMFGVSASYKFGFSLP